MGTAIYHMLQLAVLTTASVFIACKMVRYPIPEWKKYAAAGAFAVIYNLPLGMLVHVLAPIALWYLLGDAEVESTNRLPVFLLTYFFAVLLTMLAYYLTA